MDTNHLNSLPLAYSANLALSRFRQLTEHKEVSPTGAELLYERALMLDYTHNGPFSPGGSCRLMPCRDGVLAVNLPRPCDWELLPAWLSPWHDNLTLAADDWVGLVDLCRGLRADELTQRAHILGLAVSIADRVPRPPEQPVTAQTFGAPLKNDTDVLQHPPLVVDLSSLWAGPLCANLLMQAGCRVIKVEDRNRNDGARNGCPDFYRLLNQGKESVELNFRSAAGLECLKQLIDRADVVIEASRPRALRNLGIDAEQWLQQKPGAVWISITGYGREGSQGERIGFGDDCAAAAGLSQLMYEATGHYHIVGDAIADPLTGIHAAWYGWQSYLNGGNALLAISLHDTVSYCLHQELVRDREQVLQSCRLWGQLGTGIKPLFPDGPRKPFAESAKPGQHNESVFKEWGLCCKPL